LTVDGSHLTSPINRLFATALLWGQRFFCPKLANLIATDNLLPVPKT